ncbi:hypothetical protein BGW36DRAFT_362887 [Talaromyces proteolyticus]|uniref:Uncharacterized protein n=1 Tax=Talaromyces proteolyticus TaxID=1131652 RepID=A0AAD4KHB3_9EURO|nr:uncharacterized protein BGW36DRAFT_431067 [Talaromyces proteolyticus]XP_046067853.1 uncharacterized protein BGW36DRAFT_362887 [Talaromyces proteolyticus]KAH8691816.1 hypothetical protein BGW36DRAFT_431067 [Talaromyces proteolyticus]KAH8691856.1 hypothetical protein BGW36DRAFT_362887 [Talaromyces proteolyticus]
MVLHPARASKAPPRRLNVTPALSQSQVISWRFSSAPPKPARHVEQPAKDPVEATSQSKHAAKNDYPENSEQTKNSQGRHSSSALTKKASTEPIQHAEVSLIASVLNLFCALPTGLDLSKEDEELLKFYLTGVSRDVYGIRGDAVFNPVRDISFALSLRSSMTLQWMLIAAAGFVAGRRGEGLSASIFRRKSIAYQTMRKNLINSPAKGPVSDYLVDMLIMATMTESRLSQRDASNIHLRGYERAVQTRGGLRKMILASKTHLILFTSHLMPYLISAPPATDVVLGPEALGYALRILEIIARGENAVDPSDRLFTSPSASNEFTPSMNLNLNETIRLLLVSGLLCRYLWPNFSIYSRYALQTAQYLTLFTVLTGIWRLRDRSPRVKLFLHRLNVALVRSGDHNNQGQILLTMEGLMWITIKAAFDALEGVRDCQASLIVDSMSALKLFRAADETVRRRLIEHIYQILVEGIDCSMLLRNLRNSEAVGAMTLRIQDYGNFSRDINETT